jgi:hypothetical protein
VSFYEKVTIADPFKFPDFVPPPLPSPVPPPTIDAGEFIALRTLVMMMLSIAAQDQEKKGGLQAQKWINGVAEIAADAIRNSSNTDDKGRELDRVKDKAVAHVTRILGGIKLPKIEGGN